jgi:putative transposase
MLRGDLPDGIYHVTARGVDGTAVFRDDDDRRTFLRILAETARGHRWRCHAFCLMGTHYHVLVETTRERLSAGFQRLNGLYAQLFNRRHARTGHLFGDRFAARVIEDESHLAAASAYIRANPVRAGLCATPDDWPWSAARAANDR